jgi:hypothetical protein
MPSPVEVEWHRPNQTTITLNHEKANMVMSTYAGHSHASLDMHFGNQSLLHTRLELLLSRHSIVVTISNRCVRPILAQAVQLNFLRCSEKKKERL